jgi:hypothetical protein
MIFTIPAARAARRRRSGRRRDRGAHRSEAQSEGHGGHNLAGLPLARRVEDLGHIDLGERVPIGVESMTDLRPPSSSVGKLLNFVISVPKSVARSNRRMREPFAKVLRA